MGYALSILLILMFAAAIPYVLYKFGDAPLPDPLAEYRKASGRLQRGTLAFLLFGLLFANIKAIHAHPSEITVAAISVATILLGLYGVYATPKGAFSVFTHVHESRRSPSGFHEWYGILLVIGVAVLLSFLSAIAALVGLIFGHVPALSKHSWFVSQSDFPTFFWATVAVWSIIALFMFKASHGLFRKIWPNRKFNADAPKTSRPLP